MYVLLKFLKTHTIFISISFLKTRNSITHLQSWRHSSTEATPSCKESTVLSSLFSILLNSHILLGSSTHWLSMYSTLARGAKRPALSKLYRSKSLMTHSDFTTSHQADLSKGGGKNEIKFPCQNLVR